MSPSEQRAAFLANQRWFAGKGRVFAITGVEVVAHLSEEVRIELVEVTYAEGHPTTETYQMPVVTHTGPTERLDHALVETDGVNWTYDAVHDREAMALLLAAFDTGVDLGSVVFHRLPGHDLDTSTHSSLFGGEQSNSSLAFGDDSLLKVFRRVTPGANPDVEIHEALTRAGSTHVARLYGYLSAPGGDLTLAMLQQFLRTASDGWELALASARNLFAEDGAHADEVGGDFAAEAHRLGATIAEVHEVLADAFGNSTLDSAALADQMQARLTDALIIVPELGDHRTGLSAVFDSVRTLGTLGTHRVHGDLHLGQTLRTSLGWKLVDFEGEPAKDLAERRLPDSGWRDVAGMIRSFDYAATTIARDFDAGNRAEEWVAHNVQALLSGYTEHRGYPITTAERILLDAYVADKAIYEAVYETRNRPAWLPIPLAAIAGLAVGQR